KSWGRRNPCSSSPQRLQFGAERQGLECSPCGRKAVDVDDTRGSVTQLLVRAKNGDTAAMPPLLKRCYAHVLQQAKRWRGRNLQSGFADEEVAQQVLLAVWKGIERGNFPRL